MTCIGLRFVSLELISTLFQQIHSSTEECYKIMPEAPKRMMKTSLVALLLWVIGFAFWEAFWSCHHCTHKRLTNFFFCKLSGCGPHCLCSGNCWNCRGPISIFHALIHCHLGPHHFHGSCFACQLHPEQGVRLIKRKMQEVCQNKLHANLPSGWPSPLRPQFWLLLIEHDKEFEKLEVYGRFVN